jgi:hypothetical protein
VRLARWTLDLYRALMAELAASGDLLVDPGLIRSMHTRIYVENWWILLALALLWTLALGDLVRRR